MRRLPRRPPRLPSMGSDGDSLAYANSYLDERLWQLEKDIGICLAGSRNVDDSGHEHAYFPALIACCGMLELFANLHAGSTNRKKRYDRLYSYCGFLPRHGYTKDNIHVLFGLLRNSIAHHGTAAGVWKDPTSSRRITWELTANNTRPALELMSGAGTLTKDSFNPCPYSHRLRVRLDRFWRDIRDSVESRTGFRASLNTDAESVSRFHRCISQIFPS